MTRRLISRGVVSSLAAAVLFSVSLPAFAQTDAEKASARATAQQGAQAYAEGRYADAADLFGRAEALFHAPPHLLYMARAQEKQGRLVEARELYLKVKGETLAATAPEAFRTAQGEANTELAALEPRIPYLTITLQSTGPAGAKVMLDGVELPVASLGLEIPVNPGKHRVVAVTGTKEGVPQEVDVAEGARLKVEVIPAAPVAPVVAPPPPAAEEQARDPGRGLRIGSYVAFGVGAVGLGVGTVFLINGMGKTNDADDLFQQCSPGGCSTAEEREISGLDDDASSAKTISLVGYVGGAVGIGAGVTLLILSNKASADGNHGAGVASGNHARITPWVGWQSAGVSGTF